ncbi:MAG: hypothetical protein J7L53_06295 [Deltaproteobacteria bacterium]|nr:hypothetical protein [Deltaproteobacteria bacterium]
MENIIGEISNDSNDNFSLVRDTVNSEFNSFIKSFQEDFEKRIDEQSFTEDDYKLFLDKAIEAMPFMSLTALRPVQETCAIIHLSIICKKFNVKYKDVETFPEETVKAIMEVALPNDQAISENSAYIVNFLVDSGERWLLPMIYKVENAIKTLFIATNEIQNLSMLRDASRKLVKIELSLANNIPEA